MYITYCSIPDLCVCVIGGPGVISLSFIETSAFLEPIYTTVHGLYLCRLQKKGWDIRTYCDPQGKANYGRKLQPGSSNPNLSRACLFIMGVTRS